MPYAIVKKNNKWVVKNKITGRVAGTHDTEEKAKSQMRLLQGIEHGFVPSKK